MVGAGRHFRLSEGQQSLGPSWNDDGLALAGVALFRRTNEGFAPRPVEQLEALLKAAYDQDLDPATVRGLTVAAESLNRGDTARAMIAALHLRLPALSPDRAVKIGQVDEDLSKYSPDQPRDWHGRWTTESGGGPAPPAPNIESDRKPSPPSADAPNGRQVPANIGAPLASDEWGESSPPHGGRLIPADFGGDAEDDGEPPPMGDNLPPGGPRAGVPEDPAFPTPKAPVGWDIPGHVTGGVYYPPVRNPVLRNGMPWPRATHDTVKAALSQPGVKDPYMIVFVPRDGIGPPLVGSDANRDYELPEGYDPVRFFGRPQVTFGGGAETNHARDSIEQALRLAQTNNYSDIYFNRSISTIRGKPGSLIRPDVVAVARPGVDIGPNLQPYESYSPRQKAEDRERQLKDIPGLRGLYGNHYKLANGGYVLILKYIPN